MEHAWKLLINRLINDYSIKQRAIRLGTALCLVFLGIHILDSRGMLIWHIRHLRDREAFWRRYYGQCTAITAWCLSAEDLGNSCWVETEIELGIMEAHVYIFFAFRIFIDVIVGDREELAPINT